MFSLLSPLALWLAPLLAVPLAIALMGRSQPKTRDFPSLLPVHATLQRAMRRHRLKNWLQLILRTLALLCLLLAAAGPVWRGRSALPPPAVAGMLQHNGIYAAIPLETRNPAEPGTIGARDKALRDGLDSLTAIGSGRFVEETVLSGQANTGGLVASGISARYGSTGEQADALTRLFRRLDEAAGFFGEAAGFSPTSTAIHAWVPVFAGRDLPVIANATRAWLEANPGARLVLVDHGDAAARTRAFGSVELGRSTNQANETNHARDNATLTLTAPLAPASADARRPALWTSVAPVPEPPRDLRIDDERASVSLPLHSNAPGDAPWIAGTFALAGNDPARGRVAFAELPVAFRVPPPSTLCHLGARESYVSLASLGEGGERVKVVALASSEKSASDGEDCDLLYLADPPETAAALASRAAALLRTGGTVILEAGPRTDPVLWNRALLAPLNAGLLTTPLTTAPQATVPRREALSALGRFGARADRWGQPGTVTTRFGFRPNPETRVLLATAGDAGEAVLAERRVLTAGKAGRLLVWTTSLSDPSWSDIGLGPWPALLHQAVIDVSAPGIESRSVDADSVAWLDASPSGSAGTASGIGEAPQVRLPDHENKGAHFTRIRAEIGGWTLGPFDTPGLYKITRPASASSAGGGSATETDAWLAVTVAAPPPAAHAADWKAFEEALGPEAWARTVRYKAGLDAASDGLALYGGVRLRLGLLLLAALLLFAEGVVSLRLAHGSRREP